MPIPVYKLVDQCGQPCPNACSPCGPLGITAGACESLQGNGNLRGWSKMQNQNSGDWNLLKYTRLDQSGVAGICAFEDDTCTGLENSAFVSYSGFVFIDVATNAANYSNGVVEIAEAATAGDNPPPCNSPSLDYAEHTEISTGGIDPTGFKASGRICFGEPPLLMLACDVIVGGGDASTLKSTPRTRIVTDDLVFSDVGVGACVADMYDDSLGCNLPRPATASGTVTGVLSIPDSVFAALARGSPVSGASCRTSPGSKGTTSAGSDTQLSITDPEAVKVPLTLAGVTPGNYTFFVDLDVYDTSDVFQDSEEDEVTITLEESDITDCEATYEYHVPIRTGEKVEFTGVRDLAAA